MNSCPIICWFVGDAVRIMRHFIKNYQAPKKIWDQSVNVNWPLPLLLSFFSTSVFQFFFCLSVLHINIKGLQGSFVKGSVSSWCPAAGPPRLCVASTPPPPPPPPRNHSAPPPTIASTNQQLSLPTFSPGDNPSQPLTSDSCNPHLFQLQSVEAKLMVVGVRLESLLSSSSSSSVGRVGGRGSYPAQ